MLSRLFIFRWLIFVSTLVDPWFVTLEYLYFNKKLCASIDAEAGDTPISKKKLLSIICPSLSCFIVFLLWGAFYEWVFGTVLVNLCLADIIDSQRAITKKEGTRLLLLKRDNRTFETWESLFHADMQLPAWSTWLSLWQNILTFSYVRF
jgi:hypothetical protein